MGDYVGVLSNRPCHIKALHKIDLSFEDETIRNPLSSRTSKEFKYFFDKVWKELNNNE